MKKIIFAVAAAVLSAAIQADEITVGGKGVVRARPDRVSMTFDVGSLNANMDAGFAELKAKNEAVSAALSAAEVKSEEIKISNIRLSPQYNYGSSRGRNFEGYKQTCTFVISIPLDMQRVQAIYKAIVATKAGEEISLNFFIADDKNYRKEAKRLAVKDAKETAETLAEAAGVKLGKVEEISYGAGGVTPLRNNMVMAKMAFASAPDSDGMGMVTSEVDDILISESVVVIWELTGGSQSH